MVAGRKITDNELNLLDKKSRNRILKNRYSAQKTRLNRISKIKEQGDKIKELGNKIKELGNKLKDQEDKMKKLNNENNELKLKIEYQNNYIFLIEKIYNNDLYDYKNNIKKDYSIKLEELDL
tara:strand:- start:62 stop:427 length:366 start_codon:yes stop_codon:yes gene_type:complete